MTGDNRTELVRTPKRVFRCQSLKLCVAGACGVFGYLGIDDELLAQIGRMRRNRNVEKRELWLATATARILFHRGARDNGALTFRVNAPLSQAWEQQKGRKPMTNLEILFAALERMPAKDVADLLEVKPPAISMWRHGKQPFPAVHAMYLAEKLDLPAPDVYEMLADSTEHPTRKEWLRKKARTMAGPLVIVLALSFVSPTLEAKGITTSQQYSHSIYYAQCPAQTGVPYYR